MINIRKINEARKILGVAKNATLKEIKNAYRKQAIKYHPDKCKGKKKKKCEEMFKKINNANKILMTYYGEFGAVLNTKDIKKNTMDKEYYDHLKRFYDGWWGNLDL